MRSIINTLSAICLVGASLFLPGCKTSKQIAPKNDVAMSATSVGNVLDALRSRQLEYQTFTSKINMEVKKQGSSSGMAIGGQLRIKRGEGIMISLRVIMGIEVARIVVSPTQVIVIDRLNKRYLQEEIADLQKQRGIIFNYNNLEAMFTNRIFVAGKDEVTTNDYPKFSVRNVDNATHISTEDAEKIRYTFTTDPAYRLTSTIVSKDNNTLQCAYSQFVTENNIAFPTLLRFMVDAGGKGKGMSLEFTYGKPEINKEIELKFDVPGGYKQMSINEVIALLQKLS